MHPLFAALAVFVFVLALAGAFAYVAAAGARPRRRTPASMPAWMDLDGSARRAVSRHRPLGV